MPCLPVYLSVLPQVPPCRILTQPPVFLAFVHRKTFIHPSLAPAFEVPCLLDPLAFEYCPPPNYVPHGT